MTTTRRTLLKTSLLMAGTSLFSTSLFPMGVMAQSKPPASRTLRAVLQSDIAVLDPIWTNANVTAYHGAMVYDTLFGLDAELNPQPQMVKSFENSADKLTWTVELREGLQWHDGTPVTTADVIPSVKRWAARSGSGQLLFARVEAIEAVDAKVFTISLKEPFPLITTVLGATNTPVCFIMRQREAETDPMEKIDTIIGSGPFVFNKDETRSGSQYVYDRNENYVPRSEPASGTAGGKVVKVDRVVLINMPDSQTAVSALQAGEIDFYESPPIDLLEQIESDPSLEVENLFELGYMGVIGLNCLQPPFNNVKLRQSLLYIVNQEDMLRPTFADPKWYNSCASWFTCGSAMSNDANTDWAKNGVNLDKARQLMKEGGYDGQPVLILQATNVPYLNNAATVLAEQMRAAGYNAQTVPMDAAAMEQRRASQAAPEDGGWNIFFVGAGGMSISNPYMSKGKATTGTDGWFGWPTDEKNEVLRAQWLSAETEEERKKIAIAIQDNIWDVVPKLFFGQWRQPVAHSKAVTGWLHVPEVIPFWNVQKS